MNIYKIHKANPDIFTQLSLRDQLFCYYQCPQREKIIQLYSNHNQLTFTLSGKRIVRQGDNKWILSQETGFLVKRGAFLQELPNNYSDWVVLVLYLKDDYLKKVFEEFRPHFSLGNLPKVDSEIIQEFTIDEKIQNSYNSLLPYFSKPQLLPDSIFEGKFKELLFNILIHPNNKKILAYINQIIDNYTIPIWEIMETNYYYDLRISEFAEIANRSTSTFRREFEKHYQTTPGKWITAKRLEKATILLQTSNKTISEITFDCGFKNISHFSRIFKEKFQLSPTEYREHNKQ
ncbi:helix-turn-helix domain-containing protein [Algoriphagus machipongonensis]|uniref:AraC family transcriptional regulator n=1 Tax=Algoriphagus machipongonensis TaxID=388413 RepID=A3I2J9_9BACT|nr:AraC family transcriptional regulator [Algoriphagus machipongonensis]EAZ79303.1 AraC family transcriptional regulator [Algoriphagus machipongonensis]